MAKLLCLLVLACPGVAQTVQGTVIDISTGAGIAGVHIALSGPAPYSATTDAQGRFQIDDVKEGRYEWGYTATDYFVPMGGSHEFRVTVGAPVKLEGRLARMPRLSGRIADPHGEPLSKAALELQGRGLLLSEGSTDAQGRFTIRHGMPPGGYWLSVEPPQGAKPPDPDPETGAERAWARTYYPGVTTLEAAAKLDLRAGAELSNLDWKLQAVPVRSVRGVLLNSDGTPAPKVEITVPGKPALRARSQADGAFELRLVDGEWALAAGIESGGVKLRVTQWLNVAGRDIDNLKLRLSPPFTLRGAVSLDAPDGAPRPARLRPVVLLPHFNLLLGPLEDAPDATIDADGHLHADVYPGLYRIIAPAPPPGYYLDSARLGDVELSTAEVEIAGDAVISVVYKTNGGTVRGAARNCMAGQVVLIPVDPALRLPAIFGKGWCDASDRFQIQSMRPGDYYALAFAGAADIPPGGVPNYDEDTLRQGVRVTLRAGEVTEADLHAILPGQ